ncbi:Nucleoporin [Wickerhamomyces ciferrii]|uniref:Nucleoporin n=1 Tax=Wickerhamomyces ciferrii (strain ATCC 14091 / BCRC 22168 / CBS 111 / JCM 3599 / NBRC 0793 / NRRL Y-1031 F-60-10) TaxID=1206466 RepID=K0KKR4_WICCF|nr:Nucleoporin [Wickerhamomyces ciferrii]CCH42059.1 Nucleoporin [Wickerhamomyces ciferrii]
MSITDIISKSGLFNRLYDAAAQGSTFDKIAFKNEDEIFFAHGSTIRYFKSSEGPSYSVLNVAGLDFDIHGLQLNSSGTLLTAYDEKSIIVISLSFNRATKSEENEIKTNSFKIGSSIYNKSNHIIQLLWNKLSRFDSSLLVLSSDGAIRTFNIRLSPDHPDSIFDLKQTHSRKIGLSENTINDPISMCFGNSETLSGALTLYILNKEGDIFAIYPFVSKEVAVSKVLVEDLLNESLLLSHNSTRNGDLSLNEQLRFVTNLWDQVSTSQKELRGTRELCILKTDVSNYQIQGPYAIKPYPTTLYEDYGSSISSFTFKDLHLLLISYQQNGFVAVLPDQNLRMKINQNEDLLDSDTHIPALSLVQHVMFGKSLPTKLGRQLDDFSYAAIVGHSIIRLDFTSMVEEFTNTLNNNGFNEFNPQINIEVEPILRLQENEFLEGLLQLEDTNNQTMLLLTNSNMRFTTNKKALNPDFEEFSKDTEEGNELQERFLKGPYVEIENLLRLIGTVNISSGAADGSNISANDHFLRELNAISTQALQHIVTFHKLALSLNDRLINQRLELKRQVKDAYESTERLKKLKEKIDSNKKSTSQLSERQEKIDIRFKNLQEKLKNVNDLPLSSKERQWFKEVKNLTLFFNKGVKQNKELREQLVFIKNTLQTSSSHVNSDSYTDNNDWQALNDVIKEGSLLLKSTKEQLEENSAQFGKNLNESYFK